MKNNPINQLIKLFLLCSLFALQSYAQADVKVTYYVPDASGSPIAATDEQGEVLWRKHYKPFGEEIEQDVTSKDNHIGYTGHVHDRSTGLTYMGARYYDPVVGRFMAMDPAGVDPNDPATFNRYAYANNNPYKYIDPDGRDAVGIVFKGYQVNTGYGFKLPLGHAGALLIDNNSGATKYYEYGRYNSNGDGIVGKKLPASEGNVRNVSVPDVIMGENGKPTKASLDNIYKSLSKSAGKGNPVEATYHKGADFKKMESYVKKVANDPNRKKYSVTGCNCYDFKNEVINSGKSDN